jgi:hypothetical protein
MIRPRGSVAYEPEVNAKGEMHIWLEERWLSKFTAMPGPGESLRDAIVRVAASGRIL